MNKGPPSKPSRPTAVRLRCSGRPAPTPTMLKMLDVLQMGAWSTGRRRNPPQLRLPRPDPFVILMAQPNKPFAGPCSNGRSIPISVNTRRAARRPLRQRRLDPAAADGVACEETGQARWPSSKRSTGRRPRISSSPARRRPGWSSIAGRTLLRGRLRPAQGQGRSPPGPRARSSGPVSRAAPGSFIVKNTPAVQKAPPGAFGKAASLPSTAAEADALRSRSSRIRASASTSPWSSQDEGWTRYMFDDLGVPQAPPSTTLISRRRRRARRRSRPRSTLARPGSTSIVFAGEPYDLIKTGKVDPASPWARWSRCRPSTRAAGKEGIDNLKALSRRRILVTLERSCKLAPQGFRAACPRTS